VVAHNQLLKAVEILYDILKFNNIFFFAVGNKKDKSESKDKDNRGSNPMSISVPNLTCTANTAPLEQGWNFKLDFSYAC
jgi:hypothetical protein